MFFVILVNAFRWLALFIAGSSIGGLLFQGTAFGEVMLSLMVAAVIWLMAMGFDAMVKGSVTLKFLDTRQKRITAAVISFVIGLLFALGAG